MNPYLKGIGMLINGRSAMAPKLTVPTRAAAPYPTNSPITMEPILRYLLRLTFRMMTITRTKNASDRFCALPNCSGFTWTKVATPETIRAMLTR